MIWASRLFVALLCAGIWCLAQARPGPDSNYNLAISGGGGGSVTWTATANPVGQDVNGAGPVTFSGVSTGTAASGRVNVVSVCYAVGQPITGITVNSVSATKATAVVIDVNYNLDVWYATNPTGTTGNVVVSLTGSNFGMIITVGSLTGSSSGVPTATASASAMVPVGGTSFPTSSSIAIPSNGIALLAFCTAANTGTPVFTGGTVDFRTSGAGAQSAIQLTSGFYNSTGTQTPAVTGYDNTNNAGFIAVAFGP